MGIDFDTFLASNPKLANRNTDPNVIKALWYLKNDDWDSAHEIVGHLEARIALWIHGLLHKIEGDQWNANYWYSRANVDNPPISVEEEIEMIIDNV